MTKVAVQVTPADFAPPAVITRMRKRSLAVGVPFAIGAAVCAYLNWERFLHSWLFAFMFWLGLTLGSLTLLMLQYASGGNWGRLGRRFWEAATKTLPLMFLFWLPIAFGMKTIFPWASMPHDQAVKELGLKATYYLTPYWFWVRGIVYFLGWGFLAWRMNRWSRREEAGKTTPAQFVNIQNLSGAGIVFYALTITFGSIDWTMSLNPQWWSTVWGMLFMVGQVLTTFAFTIWLFGKLIPLEPLSKVFKTDHLHDYGKMMFAFVVLWAYLSFSQWLIIWSGNLLSEIKWYLDRFNGWWLFMGTFLIVFHFCLPFALLLSRNLKRHVKPLVAVALWVLFVRFVDLFWLIVPNFHRPGQIVHLELWDWVMYIVSPIAMGGIWLSVFYWQLGKRSLMPVNDPHFIEMLEAKHG